MARTTDKSTSKRKRSAGIGAASIGRALSLMAFLPIASRMPMYARLVTALVVDDRMPAARKAVLGAAAGYLVLGRDLIPDQVPVIGGLDDLAEDLLREKLDELGIPRSEYERDIAQIRRLTPGPVRRTIRRVPVLIGTAGETVRQLGIGPRLRSWINNTEEHSA
jgi:hypothetical protein